MNKLPQIKNLEKLPKIEGRTFCIGDIHGEYHKLIKALWDLGFNEKEDRVICCGDLIDRGSENDYVIDLLDENWFFSTLGNHDLMLLTGVYGTAEFNPVYYNNWMNNGGLWSQLFSTEDLKEMQSKVAKLPLAIEFESKSDHRIGVVHANVPGRDWNYVSTFDTNNLYSAESPIWDREDIQHYSGYVKNIDYVCHGHTVINDKTNEIVQIGNRFYLDTFFHKTSNLGFKVF